MTTVYVAQENNKVNYAPAEDYGRIVFLTSDEFSGLPQSLRNANVLQDICARFAAFDPTEDLIILTGNPVTMGYVFHLAFMRAIDVGVPLRYLQWDRNAGLYRVGMFPITQEFVE